MIPREGTTDPRADEETLVGYALRVLDLARAEILSSHYLLATAIGKLEPTAGHHQAPFATDGSVLGFDAQAVVEAFRESGKPPAHDLLHCILHCLLLHPFSASDDARRLWDLACDICVERIVSGLLGPRAGHDDPRRDVLRIVEVGCGSPLSAERIYRNLVEGRWGDVVAEWEPLFRVDDHAPWYDAQAIGAGQAQPAGSDARPGAGEAQQGEESGKSVGREVEIDPALVDSWRKIARRLKVALQTLPREWGSRAGVLAQEIEVAIRERVDYSEWLRQFAAPGEVLRLSDEEFDPVFYTFGLVRYGDMPLIEPLEQREDRRIREFVIVIDTSQSVSGEAVARFVDETFGILTAGNAFFEKVVVHVIQCDAEVQVDDLLECRADFETWASGLELKGFGGTDFRPAFRYVDELVDKGELQNLGGLVYFTDGYGVYPDWRPPYKVAFAFFDDDHRADEVPPWAVQVVLGYPQAGRFEVPRGGA